MKKTAIKANIFRPKSLYIGVATAVSLLAGSSAMAQSSDDGESSSRLGSLIEEVVVTVRKREEGLQDAPISVSAFTGDSLEVRGLTNISDVGSITPNLTYQNNPQAGGASSVASVYIRGVGQRDFLGTIDNGVGFYIDDVYIARTVGATVDLLDVDRVEVLRGPQGTLFGRNNVGGAVALHSKKPTEEFGGYADLTVGTDSKARLKASINAPITDGLAANFSFLTATQDGYVDRPDGLDLGDDDVTAFRGGLLWTGDTVEVHWTADFSDEEENGAAFTLVNTGAEISPVVNPPNGSFAFGFNNAPPNAPTCGGALGLSDTSGACYNNNNYVREGQNLGTGENFSDTETGGTTLRVKWDITDSLTLKSVTGYRELDAEFTRDADGSPFPIVQFLDTFETEQLSQEIQLQGTSDFLDWIAGVYYFDEEGTNVNTLNFVIAEFVSDNDFTTTSEAVFAQGTFHLSDRWDATIGVRYTDEEKTFDPIQVVGPNVLGIPVGAPILPLGLNTRDTQETTPMLNVAYQATDNVNVYATYSEGFRSGGYVQRIFPPLGVVPDFDPEFVEAYELGFKYANDEGTFTLNGAAFFMDYEDIQVRTQVPGFVGFFEDNVGTAEISGFELESKWQIADTWFFEGSVGYTDAKYTEINVGPGLTAVVTTDSEFDHVPEWSGSVSIAKEIDLGNAGFLVARLSGNYQSGYFNNAENTPLIETPATDIWDANLLWNSASDEFSVNLGVKNLTDDEYITTGYNNQAGIGTAEVILDRGLQWYLSGRYNF